MPRNSGGTYSLPLPHVVSGNTILDSFENTTDDDIGNEITNSLDRNGRGGMLAPFKIFDGTFSAPGMAFTTDPDNGFYRIGADDWAVAAGGTKVMEFTPTAVTIPAAVNLVLGAALVVANAISTNVAASTEFLGAGSAATGLIQSQGTTYGALGTSSSRADGAPVRVGTVVFEWSTQSATHKTMGLIDCVSNGGTANQRGSYFDFLLKGNGVAGNILTFRMLAQPNAVNSLYVFNAPTGSNPGLGIGTGDANRGLDISSNGTGAVNFWTNGFVSQQFAVQHTAGANRFITLTGSNGGNPTIGTSAGSLSVSATLDCSANGVMLNYPTGGNGSLAIGYSNNGIADGTTLGVIDFTGGTGHTVIARIAGIVRGGTQNAARITFNTANGGAVGEKGMFTAEGYFKASNSGTYIGATGAYHELYSDDNSGQFCARFTHAAATAANQFGPIIRLTSDPNAASPYFLECLGNATTRARIRSDGGFANFQANDVNLCDLGSKCLIESALSSWGFFRDLSVITGAYRDDPVKTLHTMISAQDVEALEERYGLNSSITPFSKQYKGVKEHNIQVRAWQTLGEAVRRIEELEFQVAKLSGQVH